MVEDDAVAASRDPLHGVGLRPAATPKATPEHDQRKPEPDRDRRQGGGVAERIGAIQYRRRRGAKPPQYSPAEEEIANERFAARYQLVGEDVPRARLETPALQQGREFADALRANVEIILDDDSLAVEQKALITRRRIVEQVVDEGNETLTETNEGMIPLAIPVRVRDDVSGEHNWFVEDTREEAAAKITAASRSDRKSTRLNSSHSSISYAVCCLKKKTANADRHAFRDRIAQPEAMRRQHQDG